MTRYRERSEAGEFEPSSADDLSALTKAELQEKAKAAGLDLPAATSKGELIAALGGDE